jgi:ATP-dependent Clp protease ATP-binding subunit ClpB
MVAVRNHFKPEFLNRVDEIVVFHRLTEADIERIVGIQVALMQTRLAERGLTLELTDAAQHWIAQTGYDPDFGARPLKRVLQREIADPIALEVLKGTYQNGDVITVDAQPDGGLVFDVAAPAEIVN